MKQVNLANQANLQNNQEFYFFDAHSHLQEPEISWDIDGIMERWQQNRGGNIVCCGTKESDWQIVFNIASQYSNVLPSFGVHPWFVENVQPKWFYELDSYLDAKFYVIKSDLTTKTIRPFIGEIGLDHVIKNVDYAKQELIFKTQMGMAKERKVPVSIHMRKGWDILIKILKAMGTLQAGGVIHSYSGPADIVPLLEKYGLYISFSGSVTNTNNKKVQKSLKAVSPRRLLIETDSPAILPQSPALQLSYIKDFIRSQKLFEMGWNEPCNIVLAAMSASEILQMDLSDLVRLTAANGENLFLP
ncbi:MAG: TatD family hydrolase [Desulfamplus sp.]